MQKSAVDLVKVLNTVEAVVSLSLTDEQKRYVLDEIERCLPPEQFCVHCLKTRAIVKAKVQEIKNGIKTEETQSQKPVKSRARKSPPAKAKK